MTLDEVASALRFKADARAAHRDFLVELIRPLALLMCNAKSAGEVNRHYDGLLSNPARIDPIDEGNAIFDQFKSKLT